MMSAPNSAIGARFSSHCAVLIPLTMYLSDHINQPIIICSLLTEVRTEQLTGQVDSLGQGGRQTLQSIISQCVQAFNGMHII